MNLGARALDAVATCWEQDVFLQAVTDATGPKYQAERVEEVKKLSSKFLHPSIPYMSLQLPTRFHVDLHLPGGGS